MIMKNGQMMLNYNINNSKCMQQILITLKGNK